MSETQTPKSPFEPFFDEVRKIVREEIERALNNGQQAKEETRDLTPEEACQLLRVDKVWLIRHGSTLPFRRKLSHRVIRYDEAGLRRWLLTRK
jgi:hypothetical protein